MALADALQEIADVIAEQDGIRSSVDDLPEQVSYFPTAVVLSLGTRYLGIPTGQLTEIHRVRIDLVVARKDATRAYAELLALRRSVPASLVRKQRAPITGGAGWTYLITIGEETTCELMTTSWGGMDILFYRYEFTIKIQGTP